MESWYDNVKPTKKWLDLTRGRLFVSVSGCSNHNRLVVSSTAKRHMNEWQRFGRLTFNVCSITPPIRDSIHLEGSKWHCKWQSFVFYSEFTCPDFFFARNHKFEKWCKQNERQNFECFRQWMTEFHSSLRSVAYVLKFGWDATKWLSKTFHISHVANRNAYSPFLYTWDFSASAMKWISSLFFLILLQFSHWGMLGML